jgi:hypothetical protein
VPSPTTVETLASGGGKDERGPRTLLSENSVATHAGQDRDVVLVAVVAAVVVLVAEDSFRLKVTCFASLSS